ncbi:polysaccharide deacetylase family protein [Larkinella rosea]|uniref:Polysaccharide deacetylase family protein n=1 Tax=Larkinella rosea TaxID=2025312 RepID=A0A3P1C221_9BACT|nr:polysaccharide deacetylase family protein [Larkinella rosea]RRB07146.1 polysaccharide deacetylase family protein [Larkinella rosea]
MFLHKTNFLLRTLFPRYQWRVRTPEKVIYLTFDDGPIPEVTEFVLETLHQFDAKATFFCIGDNVRKNPGIFGMVQKNGHSIGNHTFNHLNGWKTDDEPYLANFHRCQDQLGVPTRLFRPPYGRLKSSQGTEVLKTHDVVMWDVLTGDFSLSLQPEVILQKTLKYTESGSIVLFHDSIKAWPRMSYALPRVLSHFSELGYRFDGLPQTSGLRTPVL